MPLPENVTGSIAQSADRDLPTMVPARAAAEYLNVTTRTLRRWIRSRKLHAVRTAPSGSGRVLIPRDELVRFLVDRIERPSLS